MLGEISTVKFSEPKTITEGEFGVNIEKANATWNSDAQDLTLNDINLKLRTGQLVAAIGPVGSGKVCTYIKEMAMRLLRPLIVIFADFAHAVDTRGT